MDILIIIIPLIFAIIMIVIAFERVAETKRKGKEMERALDEQSDFFATQKVIGCDCNSGMAIDEERSKVALVAYQINGVSIRVINCRDLLCSEVFEDGATITKTSRTSQIGGALVGGLLLGGVGAVIGGLSGKTTTSGKVKRIELRLTVNDTNSPIHDVVFQDALENNGSLVHNQSMKQARHWHGLVDVLIKRAEIESRSQVSRLEGKDSQVLVADEIKKLAELQAGGLLSAEEFRQRKTILLNRA